MAGIRAWSHACDLDFRHDPAGGSGAVFSPCWNYRYLLWRLPSARANVFGMGMLNPSTADEHSDDPTIARCRRIAAQSGFANLLVWNLFACRATAPADLKRAAQPVGQANDAAIELALALAPDPLIAWGNHGHHLGRGEEVLVRIADAGMTCSVMGLTKQGQPKHPLYLPGGLVPVQLDRDEFKALASSSPGSRRS